MNCKICGAELKRPGELCNNCMRKLMLEKESRDDKTEVLTVKKKFSLWYEILSHLDSIGVAIFLVIIIFSLGDDYKKIALICIPAFLFWGIAYLLYSFINKSNSSITFYNTKIVYKYRRFKKKTVTISFKEINEINYQLAGMGRVFNIGSLIIKTNSSNILKRNIIIDSIPNVEGVIVEIQKLMK